MIIYFHEVLLSALYFITMYYAVFWLICLFDVNEEDRPKNNKISAVSIIIPAYNEERNIEKAVESVINLDYPKNKVELIVVNDGSKDNTKKVVLALIKKCKDRKIVLINQKNHGKWHALNQGLDVARGEFVAVLDADSTVRKDALEKMIPYFEKRKVAVVLPLLKVNNPKNMLQKIQGYEYIINMFYKKMTEFLDCIHVAPGPFSLYKTEVLRKVGGFKPGHKTEDLEIVLRLQENHYKIIQTTETEAYTESPDNLKDLYYQRKRWNLGSTLNIWDYRKMLFNKRYGDFGIFQLPIVFAAGFIALTIIFITAFIAVKPLFSWLMNLNLISFDIKTLLQNYVFDFNLLDINYYGLSIAVFVMTITAIFLLMAHRYAKERIGRYGLFSLIAFVFFYYAWLGIVWFGVTKSLLLGKETKW